MSLEAEKTSTAKPPFDNPECDIILRSADGVDFHVYKIILSLVSPVFQNMFTLPQDKIQSDISSVPIISMTENSTTLESLLLLCYPAATPTFNSLEDAKAVIEVARKYDIGAALNRARDIIFTHFLPTDSLELYALSCMSGWWEHSQMAATRTLDKNLKDAGRPGSEFVGMRDISAYDYHKLLVYHYECGIAAQVVGLSLTWLIPPSNDMCMWRQNATCNGSYCSRKVSRLGGSSTTITAWFEEYLVSSGKELYARPCESTLWTGNSASYNYAINKAFNCIQCRNTVVLDMETFRTLYAAQVKKVVANVKLKAD